MKDSPKRRAIVFDEAAFYARLRHMDEHCPKGSLRLGHKHDMKWPYREPWNRRIGEQFYGTCKKCGHSKSNRC